MTTDVGDHAYLVLREAQERQRADEATDPTISRVHRQLAEMYAARVSRTERDEPEGGPVFTGT